MTTAIKHISVTFVLVMIFQISFSQSPMGLMPMDTSKPVFLDSANYLISYKMTFATDSLKPKNVISGEYVLLVGKKYSKFFNAHYLEKPNREVVNGAIRGIDGNGLAGTEVFKSLTDNMMEVTTIVFGSKNVYRYIEEAPNISWKIEGEKKTILGYVCQKATTSFLGRYYIAWFTSEIPLTNGPWKFGKLSGLILQVSDSRNHYSFECNGIQALKGELPIVKYDVRYDDITRKSLNQLIKRMHLNFDQYMEAQGKIMTKGSQRNLSFPYNPIELE